MPQVILQCTLDDTSGHHEPGEIYDGPEVQNLLDRGLAVLFDGPPTSKFEPTPRRRKGTTAEG